MATRPVRVRKQDVATIERMSGLPEDAPFAMKIHVVLNRAEAARRDQLEGYRRMIRAEIKRAGAGKLLRLGRAARPRAHRSAAAKKPGAKRRLQPASS